MKLDLKAIQEKRTNLNAQEIGDAAERAKGWKRFDRNPVFDEAELTKIVKAGVNRLTEMQLSDGGWGWFSGWGEQSTPHTTAVVVHGLQIAKQNDVALVPGVLERGVDWLKQYQDEQLRRARQRRRRRQRHRQEQAVQARSPTTSTRSSTWSSSTPTSRTTRCAITSTATAPSSPFTA